LTLSQCETQSCLLFHAPFYSVSMAPTQIIMPTIQDTFFHRLILFTSQYTPYVQGSTLFEKLNLLLRKPEVWREKVLVDKKVFEQMLVADFELQLAYVDNYSSKAEFTLIFFEYDNVQYEFYCMLVRKKIVLVFFRKSI
jgi:hypothetical protein